MRGHGMNQRKRSDSPAVVAETGGADSLPLLATKLHLPPVRPNLVSRPRLVESLTQRLEHRLILLSAPAGFGKTTLLSEWLATHPCPAGWLSLDRGEYSVRQPSIHSGLSRRICDKSTIGIPPEARGSHLSLLLFPG